VFNFRTKWHYFVRITNFLVNIGVKIGGVFLIGLMCLTVLNIVVRFFGKTVPGYYDIIVVMLVIPISIALVYASVQKAHVVIDIVISRFSIRSQLILQVFTSFIGLSLWVMILVASIGIIPEKIRTGEWSQVIGIPYLPFRLIWVFALFLFCVVLLIDTVNALKKVIEK